MPASELPEYLIETIPNFLKSMVGHSYDSPVKASVIEEGLTKMIQTRYPDKKVSDSQVRQIVRYLRRAGYPIGSGPKGYFWAKDEEEWKRGLNNLRSRALDMLSTYNDARRSKIDKYNNQEKLSFPEVSK